MSRASKLLEGNPWGRFKKGDRVKVAIQGGTGFSKEIGVIESPWTMMNSHFWVQFGKGSKLTKAYPDYQIRRIDKKGNPVHPDNDDTKAV